MAAAAVAVPLASGVFVDWSYTFPGWLRIGLALAMLLATAAVAGRRIAWLVRLIRSGRPAVGRTDDLGERAESELRVVLPEK